MGKQDHIEIKTERLNDAVVLRPVGDIDLSRAPSLRVQLGEVQRSRPMRLIVDLEEVPYMDSSGVATLVEAMQIARRNGSKLILCSMSHKVKGIFEIARLDMVFTIVDDREQALTT